MMERQLIVMEFPGLLCLIFLFVFIIVINIVCTSILIKLVAKHTSILKLVIEKECVIEPLENTNISQSLENMTTMMEKFMWFYVSGVSLNHRQRTTH